MNSSNSSKKEKINNSPSIKNINNTKKTIAINNLKSIINNNISSEILTTIIKGIISLKKNDIFDYIIKILKIILYYYKDKEKYKKNINNELDNNVLNLLYQNISKIFNKDTLVKNILLNDFNKNKKIFKNIHCIVILYIYCGIVHINEALIDKDKKIHNINSYLDYNEIINILYNFINNEQCKNNENKNEICILCSKLNMKNYINKNKETIISNNNRKSSLNINEKKVFNKNRKNLKNKLKIKKNINNFFNSDISLKLVKSNITNKSTKNNKNILNNSNDKRLLNYLKTTIEDKYKNNLNSHRDFEVDNKDIKLKNIISIKNKNNNNKSVNKIYNYSYKNNILNINSNKNNIKENISLQNFFSGKNQKNINKNKSNININNNHQIFFYPKVEQFLNNVYIINDNKNINSKLFNEGNNNDEILEKDIRNNKDKKNINDINILNNMEIINKQINSMENIFNNFKTQTMEIRKQMMEIGKKINN